MGGGPHGGSKPASEETGQAEACPARPAIEMRQPDTMKCRLHTYGATAPSNAFGLLHPAVGFTTTRTVYRVALGKGKQARSRQRVVSVTVLQRTAFSRKRPASAIYQIGGRIILKGSSQLIESSWLSSPIAEGSL